MPRATAHLLIGVLRPVSDGVIELFTRRTGESRKPHPFGDSRLRFVGDIQGLPRDVYEILVISHVLYLMVGWL